MFEEILEEQNPHWKGELHQVKIQRSCFPVLMDYLDSSHIVTITGVRRSGKSTLIYLLIDYLIQKKGVNPNNILFLSLEETRLIPFSEDPANLQILFEDYKKIRNPQGEIYCFFDEIQFFESWEVFIKSRFERGSIRFVITGSNSHMLTSELMTLLSGRTLPLELYPLSFEELARWQKIKIDESLDFTAHRIELKRLFEHYMEWGGFPAVNLEPKTHVRSQILNSIAKTIIYRDVIPRLHIRKSSELEILYAYLISNIGNCYSYHKLAKQFHLSDKSVKEYIRAFSDVFLLFELDAFSFSVQNQIRNPKKIYSVDVGLITAIAFRFSGNHGKILENLVFLELKRLGLELFYYKTANGLEVDFCARKGVAFSLVQVSWEMSNNKTKDRELSALLKATSEMKLEYGFIITAEKEGEMHEEGKTIHLIPAYKFFCFPDEKKLNLLYPQ